MYRKESGVYVGYRYYCSSDVPVRFPFGHGLSYTSFSYSGLRLGSGSFRRGDVLSVSVRVRNTGGRSGKAVVQLYVGNPEDGQMIRPVRELRDFAKVELEPGEEKEVCFSLGDRAFSYYDDYNWDL